MYTILGATGNIGSKIVPRLLGKGSEVRAIGRDAAKLAPLVERGAKASVGNIEDVKFLTDALRGAEAVFTVIPPNYQAPSFKAHYDRISENICQAIALSGVKYVVNLSSIGAELPAGTGPIKGLHAHEARLDRLEGVNILHLRPAYFMENLLANVPLLKSKGIMGGALKANVELAMIATDDIAAVAAERLLNHEFTGKKIELLLGQRDLTMNEVAKCVSEVLGKQIPYIEFDYASAKQAMVGLGFSADTADQLVEMTDAFNTGHLSTRGKRTPQNTTPTRIEDFARVFKLTT